MMPDKLALFIAGFLLFVGQWAATQKKISKDENNPAIPFCIAGHALMMLYCTLRIVEALSK